jgi:hypothetical protein
VSDTENKKAVKFDKLDGGINTLYPPHQLPPHQSGDAKNFDVSNFGSLKTRKGYSRFTASAKGSPTGTGISGLFAGSQYNVGALKVWQVTAAAVFMDITSAFNQAGAASLFPAGAALNDYCAIGFATTFAAIGITLTTLGVGGTLAWEYWNGSAWTALTTTDSTSGLTATGTVTFTPPGSWASTTLNGTAAFYIRARVTVHFGTVPIASRGYILSTKGLVVASEGTTIHDISAGTWGSPLSGATPTLNSRVHFMLYNNLLLIGNKAGGPWKTVDVVTAVALGGSPPANSIGGMIHRSRVWWFQDNSSAVTFSALNSEEDYVSADNAGSIVINNGDGMIVNCVASGGLFAAISKISPSSGGTEGKLYIVTGSSTFDFAVQKMADFGVQGPDCMVSYDNMIVAATNRGVYVIQQTVPTKLSQNIKPSYDAIVGQATLAMGKWRTTIRLSYSSSAGANDSQFALDLERGVWGLNATKPFSRYAGHPDGRLLAGSNASAIVYVDESGTNDDSAAINMYWVTKLEDFGISASPAHLAEIDLHADNTGNWAITVTHLINGTDTGYSDTMNVSTEGPVKRMKRTKNKRGKLHQIKVAANLADKPVTIHSITVWGEIFNPGVI